MTKTKIKKKFDNDLQLYLDIQKTLTNYLNYFKNVEYKYVDCQESFIIYTTNVINKRKEINSLINRIRKALCIKSITEYF